MIRGHDDHERRLAMYRLVAEKVRNDPSLLDKARAVLTHWRPERQSPALDEWSKLLDQGVDACLAVLTEDSPRADTLRMSSPFAGILPNGERIAFLREWAKRYDTSGGQEFGSPASGPR